MHSHAIHLQMGRNDMLYSRHPAGSAESMINSNLMHQCQRAQQLLIVPPYRLLPHPCFLGQPLSFLKRVNTSPQTRQAKHTKQAKHKINKQAPNSANEASQAALPTFAVTIDMVTILPVVRTQIQGVVRIDAHKLAA